MSSSKAFRFVTVSTLIHTGAVLALLVAPALMPTPEPMGTETGTTVEFETSTPLGEQTETPVKASEEIAAPAPVKAEKSDDVAEVVVPKKAEPKKEVVKKEPVKKAFKEPEAKIATVLPPKQVVEKTEEAAPETVPVVAVEPENIDSEISDEPVIEEVADSSEIEKELMMAAEETPAPEKTQLQPVAVEEKPEISEMAEEELKEETLVEEALAEDAAKEEAVAPVAAIAGEDQGEVKAQDSIVVGDSTQAAPSSAAQNFGTSQGLRNYEDLSQVPGNKPPQYPEQARLQKQQGQVVLQYFVTASGQVSNMKLIKSSGYASLDQEAVNSVGQFKYRPGQQGWTVHPVNFTLKGPEQKMGGRLRTSMR